MKRLVFLLWAVALLVAAMLIWRGIAAAMGDPFRLGYVPGTALEFDEEIQLKEQSLNGPFSGDWEFVQRSKVRMQALSVEADGTIVLISARRQEVPVLSKYLSNKQDMMAKFGATFAQQLHTDPCTAKRLTIKPTGDTVGEKPPGDLDGAVEEVFRRSRLLPGGRIDVDDSGHWTENIGPLLVKFEWKVSGREKREGRSCLVYEVRPSAVLGVQAESMPNFMGSIVWHTGEDEGYVTTKGSVVKTWLSEDDHLPLAFESLEKLQVVPQKYVGQYREVTRKLKLARQDVATGDALKEAEAFAQAEGLAAAGKTQEAVDAMHAILGLDWADWAAARARALAATLPLVMRPCPALPGGTWIGDTPKTLETLAGKVVVVDFWLLSAPPCIESMKALKTIRHRYEDRGLYVFGVTCEEPQRESEQIQKYLSDALIDYPILVAESGISDPRFQVQGLPYCLLVDRKGVVRWTGSPADPGLEAAIQTLLAEK